ncbi:MAG: hypothetical protein KGP14_13310 [Betaproteobacteria bacterium]|nr:hypothetical protein [Betaproteobacteria bacterium]
MDRVFADPEAVLDEIRSMAPFSTIGSQFAGPEVNEVPNWFMASLTESPVFHDPVWIPAACEAFGAKIVRPLRCALNLNPPAPGSPPHLDMSSFRGFAAPEAPIWLLGVMGRSHLFLDWLVPIASGIAWFWRGNGGELEYWADGANRPPSAETSPLWNVGVMSDNEVMWHRVGAIGPAERRAEFGSGVPRGATLHLAAEGWEMRYDGRQLTTYRADEVRISIVWKGLVFRDEDHLASFENHDYDLRIDQVVSIFAEDLADRGLPAPCPSDPLNNPEWKALLERTYRSPFDQAD